MSKLKQKRLDIVMQVMRTYGIEHGDKCVISLYELAFNINNTWNAEHFVNVKRFKSDSSYRYCLPSHEVGEIFRAVRGCLSRPLELRESYYNKSEYVLWTNYKAQ